MKKFRIIKRLHPVDFNHDYESRDFIIQRKGWFGWKTLIERYGSFGVTYTSWSYFSEPYRCSRHDTFETKKEAILFLDTYYNNRPVDSNVVCEWISDE